MLYHTILTKPSFLPLDILAVKVPSYAPAVKIVLLGHEVIRLPHFLFRLL
jgi:hypothetical protein